MKTIRHLFFITFACITLISIGCQKKVSITDSEENLTVQTTPATTDNNVEAPAPGPSFPLKVTITSRLPAKGVKIDVKARQDGSITNFFSESRNSTTAENNFVITGTPKTVICVVDITVTSLSTSSNKWAGSYRYSSK